MCNSTEKVDIAGKITWQYCTNETWIYFRVVNVQYANTWCFSTFLLRMPHMCSIGFRSGDILGHSITFSRKAVVVLAVCLGWLCWKTVSERMGIIFCIRMSQYMLESMFPSMNRSSPLSPLILVRPVPSETHLGKPLYDPGHCTVTQFQAVTELLKA